MAKKRAKWRPSFEFRIGEKVWIAKEVHYSPIVHKALGPYRVEKAGVDANGIWYTLAVNTPLWDTYIFRAGEVFATKREAAAEAKWLNKS